MKKFLLPLTLFFIASLVQAQETLKITMQSNEYWYGAATDLGSRMPFKNHTIKADLRTQNFNNQTSSLLLSNTGRCVWSSDPFLMEAGENSIQLQITHGTLQENTFGKSLKEAYLGAMRKYFPATNQCPPTLFFTKPIYNSWIELLYNQNQADILKYARSIIDNGFSPGILMIDDNWQKDYGDWDFRPDRFPNPKEMIDTLHTMGFKVMLWVCPFVSPDSKLSRDLEKEGYFIKKKNSNNAAIVKWWNGYSFAYDLSNPKAFKYIHDTFMNIQSKYGIDGFKFDAGDPEYYAEEDIDVFNSKSFGTEQTKLWAQLALDFPYNEMRACWQLGSHPLVQRLGDKKYSWKGVSELVPNMIAAGLLGYAYTCPDMIGGGEYSSFYGVVPEKFNQELMVRSCQIHAMMPIMQFSVAPWRMLNQENLAICQKYAKFHESLGDYIYKQAIHSAETGEPIVRHMAYSFPNEGFETVTDQYMFGDKYLVAPMMNAGTVRDVKLPKGTWKDDQGKKYKGGKSYRLNVPLSRLPWFILIKK